MNPIVVLILLWPSLGVILLILGLGWFFNPKLRSRAVLSAFIGFLLVSSFMYVWWDLNQFFSEFPIPS